MTLGDILQIDIEDDFTAVSQVPICTSGTTEMKYERYKEKIQKESVFHIP